VADSVARESGREATGSQKQERSRRWRTIAAVISKSVAKPSRCCALPATALAKVWSRTTPDQVRAIPFASKEGSMPAQRGEMDSWRLNC
jgi:hypothetical protein